MKFLHIADIHLGFEQYGERERFNDFSRTFLWLMDFAVAEKVDFVLLAGDLFHKRAVDPLAMQVAIHGLSKLSCPVFAIEGNHEKAYFIDQDSWVDFLGSTGRVHLLDHNTVNIPGARVCGIKYAGARTDAEAAAMANELGESDDFTIMLVHAGLEGQLSHAGGIAEATVEAMDNVNYVALGHIHKPYISGKAYNPGSPETVSADEALWPDRGALLVSHFKGLYNPTIDAQVIVPPRRHFHRFDIGMNGSGDPQRMFLAIEYIRSLNVKPGSVIDVIVSGEVQFSRSDLDIKGAKESLESLSPLVVHVRNETAPVGFSLSMDGSRTNVDAEREVLLRVIQRDARYRDEASVWVDKAITVKSLAITSTPEAVMDYIERLP